MHKRCVGRWPGVWAAVGALAAACAPVTPPTVAPAPVVSVPASTGTRYRWDREQCVVRVYVYRGGTLAALGHNHVLVARGVRGEFALPDDPRGVSGSLAFAVDDFSVDDVAERQAAGADFPGAIDAGDIAGTRRNLLGPGVLDALRWPEVAVEFSGARGGPDDYVVAASLQVRGVASAAEVPLHLSRAGAALGADGELILSQAGLGLTPFSILLGALKVEDALHVRFHLVAVPAT